MKYAIIKNVNGKWHAYEMPTGKDLCAFDVKKYAEEVAIAHNLEIKCL